MEDDKRMSPFRIIHPVAHWFAHLQHFDEVPLPPERWFSLAEGELREHIDGEWIRAPLSVNELLVSLSGLSREQWRELTLACQGDEDAQEWRKKILYSKLPG